MSEGLRLVDDEARPSRRDVDLPELAALRPVVAAGKVERLPVGRPGPIAARHLKDLVHPRAEVRGQRREPPRRDVAPPNAVLADERHRLRVRVPERREELRAAQRGRLRGRRPSRASRPCRASSLRGAPSSDPTTKHSGIRYASPEKYASHRPSGDQLTAVPKLCSTPVAATRDRPRREVHDGEVVGPVERGRRPAPFHSEEREPRSRPARPRTPPPCGAPRQEPPDAACRDVDLGEVAEADLDRQIGRYGIRGLARFRPLRPIDDDGRPRLAVFPARGRRRRVVLELRVGHTLRAKAHEQAPRVGSPRRDLEAEERPGLRRRHEPRAPGTGLEAPELRPAAAVGEVDESASVRRPHGAPAVAPRLRDVLRLPVGDGDGPDVAAHAPVRAAAVANFAFLSLGSTFARRGSHAT